jgi:tocopherol O-methyltransferase
MKPTSLLSSSATHTAHAPRRGANEALPPPRLTPFDVHTHHEALAVKGLARKGPRPRVYGHTGLVDHRLPPPGTQAPELREHLWSSQETLLTELARAMGPLPDGVDVLDVGSVLGGSALFWAQHLRASVTALITVPAHLEQVHALVSAAGPGSRVMPRLSTESTSARAGFDAVIAVENTSAVPRAEWLHRVHARLKPGGLLAVADCFWVRPGAAHPSEDAWRGHLCSLGAFLAAARDAGLELVLHDDVSARAVGFWTLCAELLVHEHLDGLSPTQPRGLRAALNAVRGQSCQREHLWLQQGLLDGGLEYALLVLRRGR